MARCEPGHILKLITAIWSAPRASRSSTHNAESRSDVTNLSDRYSRRLSSSGGQTCCGVVSNVCCDVSVPVGTVFKPSAAPLLPLKPAIACTS